MNEITIDARGLSCPEPVLKTREQIFKQEASEFKILVDSEVARDNICNQAELESFSFSIENQGEDYLITLKKRK